mmetsp:Transcript_15627/g.49813  ORF Transcript_15627/g.49813 Transcript_15627/m.49813 type:complete len:309 (+) Transcript_15627:1006-1932(+)
MQPGCAPRAPRKSTWKLHIQFPWRSLASLMTRQRLQLSAIAFACIASMASASLRHDAEQFADRYKDVLFGVVILVGLVQCFWGYKILKPSVFIAGAAVGGIAGYYAGAAAASGHASEQLWAFGAMIVLAIIVGVFLLALLEAGIFILGCVLGVTVALLLNDAVLYRISESHPHVVLYVAMGVMGIAFGLIALWKQRPIIIVATALGGAYAAAYGIGHFAGHFPNPLVVKRDVSTGHYEAVPKEWWYYAGGTVVVALVGAIVQFRSTKDDEEKEDRSYHTLPHRDPYTAGRPVRMAGRPLAHAQYGSSW